MTEEHNFQWGQTAHLGTYLASLVQSTKEEDKKTVEKMFLESPAFATVKFDGTNVGKCAINGHMLGRRVTIPPGTTKYQRAKLDRVIEAKVHLVRDALLKDVGDGLGELALYGELMCNKDIYDYSEQCLYEEWLVFGALAQDVSENGDMVERLIKAGFAAKKKEDDDEVEHDEKDKNTEERNQVQLFPNEKFVSIVENAGMRTTRLGIVGRGTLAEVISENKDWIKSMKGEGLVITLGGKEEGYQLLKWKGQQERQHASNEAVKSILAQDLGLDFWIMNMFKQLEEIIDAGPKSPKNIKAKPKVEKGKVCVTENEEEAVKSAMTKFDDPESYFEKSLKLEYEKLIIEEAVKSLNAEDEMIRKAVNWQVKKVVGQLYGQFRSKNK